MYVCSLWNLEELVKIYKSVLVIANPVEFNISWHATLTPTKISTPSKACTKQPDLQCSCSWFQDHAKMHQYKTETRIMMGAVIYQSFFNALYAAGLLVELPKLCINKSKQEKFTS